MDHDRFDALTKSLVTRRAGIGLALAALLRLTVDGAGAKQHHKPKPKRCQPKCSVCRQCTNGKCKPKPNGTVCGSGKVCRAGDCACGEGRTTCGSACVDVSTDSANCGRCNNACSAGSNMVCQGGQCACRPGQEVSGGICGVRPVCQGANNICTQNGDCCSDSCQSSSSFSACAPSESGQKCKTSSDCASQRSCVGFICTA